MEAKEQPGIGTRWASAFSSRDHSTFMKLNWNNLRLNWSLNTKKAKKYEGTEWQYAECTATFSSWTITVFKN